MVLIVTPKLMARPRWQTQLWELRWEFWLNSIPRHGIYSVPNVEFTYNTTPMGMSPFTVVYWMNHLCPLYWVPSVSEKPSVEAGKRVEEI